MNKGYLLVFLSLILSFPCLSQDPLAYFDECISSPEPSDVWRSQLEVNSEGEIYHLNEQYPKSMLVKRDRNGVELWRKDLPGAVQKFWMDEFGNACLIVFDEFDTKIWWFYRYQSNGNVNFFPYSISNIRRIDGDQHGNTYVLFGFPNSSNTSIEYLFFIKFDAVGNSGPTKFVSDKSPTTDGYPDLIINASGEAAVRLKVWESDEISYDQVVKLDGNGDVVWRTSLDPLPADEYQYFYLYMGPSGNVIGSIDKYKKDTYVFQNKSIVKFDNQTGSISSPLSFNNSLAVWVQFSGDKIFMSNDTKIYVFTADLLPLHEFSIGLSSICLATILTDASGTFVISGAAQTAGNPTVFILKYEIGNLIGRYTTSSTFTASGDTAFDFENNLLWLDESCLFKVIPCEKIQIKILNQPQNIKGCAGQNLSMGVSAQGQNLSFYWYKDDVQLTDALHYGGINGPVLTVKQTSTTDVGKYYCIIRDRCRNFSTTEKVTLNITSLPTLTSHPEAAATPCLNEDVVFKITTAGGENVKYQWKKGNTSLIESASLVGTETNTLTIKAVRTIDAGDYYCEVTADCQPSVLASKKGTLSVRLPTLITTNPTSLTACEGKSINLSVNASGTELIYQWKRNGTNISESARITGTKTNTLALGELQKGDAGEYTCVVSGLCGENVTSTKGILVVTPNQQITSDPQPSSICSGLSSVFSVGTSGTVLSYQWMKKNTLLTNNTKYSGVNTASLTIKNATVNEEGVYACLVTTTCGTQLISKSAALTIVSPVSVTAYSPALSLCTGDLAEIFVTVSGGSATFRWLKDGVSIQDNESTAGSGSSTLHLDNVDISSEGKYTCQITPSCGLPYTSNPISVTVKESLKILEQPVSQNICEEEKLTLNISVEGYFTSYQWKFKGDPIMEGHASGTKTATLSIQQPNRLDEGYYTCEITGCAGVIASEAVHVQVNQKPELALKSDIDCDISFLQWSDLVQDNNNTYGEFALFEQGSSKQINLEDIKHTGLYRIVKQTATCSDAVEWNNTCIVTGNEEGVYQNFEIFPNPTDRWIQFRYDATQVKDFELFDSKGLKVGGGTLPITGETTLDGALLGSGIYMVRFLNKSGHSTFERLIINR